MYGIYVAPIRRVHTCKHTIMLVLAYSLNNMRSATPPTPQHIISPHTDTHDTLANIRTCTRRVCVVYSVSGRNEFIEKPIDMPTNNFQHMYIHTYIFVHILYYIYLISARECQVPVSRLPLNCAPDSLPPAAAIIPTQ